MEKLLAKIDKCIKERCKELEKETLEKGERDTMSAIQVLATQIEWNNNTKWKMPYFAKYVKEKMEDFYASRHRNWVIEDENGIVIKKFMGTEIGAEFVHKDYSEHKLIDMKSTFDIFGDRYRRKKR